MSYTYRIVYLSLLVALSLSLFLLEGLIPLPFLAPGAKLGLSNLITVVALYSLPHARDALLVLFARILLSSLFGGGPTILFYSLAGGLLSFGLMILLKRSNSFSMLGVSAAGGFFHNVGQLLIASLVLETPRLWNNLPILAPCGIFTGLLIGMVSAWTLKKINRRQTPGGLL